MTDVQQALDDVLRRVTTGSPRAPGVVAVVTDRERDVHAGAAGERVLGSGEEMTPDTVCAISWTTKAVSVQGHYDLETAVYQALGARGSREPAAV